MAEIAPPVRVSLLAIADSYLSCLTGLFDTLRVSSQLFSDQVNFSVEIVARTPVVERTASGMPIAAHRTLSEIAGTDIVIVPATETFGRDWTRGRYPVETAWLEQIYAGGSVVCSVCSGALLVAEAGLLAGEEATTHWTLAEKFQEEFPDVGLKLDRELVISGDGGRLVTAGASAAWHDLALYLVTRYGGPATAREVARHFMLQWHPDGQAPYLRFEEKRGHGDAAILRAQAWLQEHWQEQRPVAGMVAESGLSERNFSRRFRRATGHSPIAYVHQLRIEKAKHLLESSDDPVEAIGWEIGYEDPSSFRRLFQRLTNLSPGGYRRRFRPPERLLTP